MKKLFALLLLPSIAFAGKIGENYVGVGSGFIKQSLDIRTTPSNLSWDSEYDGWAFSFGVNFNLAAPSNERSWGTDVSFSYTTADLEPNSEAINYVTAVNAALGIPNSNNNPQKDLEVTSFTGTLTPFVMLGDGKLFASLGFGRSEMDDSKETGLLLGAGYQATFDKLTLTPSITHTSLDNDLSDSFSYGIEISYELTKTLDLILGYSHSESDKISYKINNETVNIDPSADVLAFGITYNF